MASRHHTQLFPNMSNTTINTLTISQTHGNTYLNASDSRPELEVLRSKISTAALHNSGERYDAPRCHPGTRVGIQGDIMKWLDTVNDPQLVFWMYGSAGVGKSAIAQAIAMLCYNSNPCRLGGAFFLSRSAPPESGRGDEKHLVATLAYQMTKNIPGLETHVANAIAGNKVIFDLDLDTQIMELILRPLTTLSDEMSNRIAPMIFILDALDECSRTSSQIRIVEAFVAAIAKMQHKIPHKLLIASRPESHIMSIFSASEISPAVRSVSLDRNYHAEEDIQKFLIDGFLRFRETHPLPAIFPLIWPMDDDINRLVWRSGGHFIYASTAQRYIQEDHANPILRLQSILDVTEEHTNRAFAQLDALYSYIFRQVKELETVLYLMCIRSCEPFSTITFCEGLLGLPQGGGLLALQGLSSLGKINDYDNFEAYHASLTNFLQDEHRAGNFYIYNKKICTHLSCLALEYIPLFLCCDDKEAAMMQLESCFEIVVQCTRQIKGPHPEIHEVLSNFDFDMLFEFFGKIKQKTDHFKVHHLNRCSEFFQWLFDEHQNLAHSKNMILLSPFSQLQKWTLEQLERFQFDKPPSRWSLDYWASIFVFRDAEMCIIQGGLTFPNSWVVGSAPQASSEDRITQLMSRYCYYILNSSWSNWIRNARLGLRYDDSDDQEELKIWRWANFFDQHAPLQIDQYLDIQHILGLNSLVNTAASLKDFEELPLRIYITLLISNSYQYLLKVEKEFSCLTSPLNKLEESPSTAEAHTMDRICESSPPYIPYPSDSPSFTLALTFHTICHVEYRDTELGLPVV